MITLQEEKYVADIPRGVRAVLGADIGGTNSNFGIFVPDRKEMLFSLHAKSQEVNSFSDLIKQVLAHCKKEYDLSIHNACFAAAGVVSSDRTYCKPTNLDLIIDTNDVIEHTELKCIFLVNDFTVIGYGMNFVRPEDVVQVKGGKQYPKEHKAILGAGTGLGKCILWWNTSIDRYVPLASEGGHADFAAQTEQELSMIHYIQKKEGWGCAVSWEDVLSGEGIKRMYAFFKQTNNNKPANAYLTQNGLHPDEIFKSRTLDDHAWHTYQYYSRFYARCAKNFALDALARGGVYIAGGIAAKNLELFEQDEFLQEFINCGKQQELLKEIPVYVITDYNVSLYGAVEYLRLVDHCK